MKSFSEIETTVKRATKAIGFSWGIAEEVGKNMKTMELFGLPGVKNLNEYFKNYPINKIIRNTRSVKIFYGGENEFFNYDKVVVATHADEALKLIEKPTLEEIRILKNFKYRDNTAINAERKWCVLDGRVIR